MRYVVVTGGGTGIGLAVAAEFARRGDAVTITGRREQVLKDAATALPAKATEALAGAGARTGPGAGT
ncbi:MAG TPA: SDR family NAD(P)-dependent oxidoreductase, partial [Streptosporangiaceae bacterium]